MPLQKIKQIYLTVIEQITAGDLKAARETFNAARDVQTDKQTLAVVDLIMADTAVDFYPSYDAFLEKKSEQSMPFTEMLAKVVKILETAERAEDMLNYGAEKLRKKCEKILGQIAQGELEDTEAVFQSVLTILEHYKRFDFSPAFVIDSKTIDFPAGYSGFLNKKPLEKMTVTQMLSVVQVALDAFKSEQEVVQLVKQVKFNCKFALEKIVSQEPLEAKARLARAKSLFSQNPAIATRPVKFYSFTMTAGEILTTVEEIVQLLTEAQLQSEKAESTTLPSNELHSKVAWSSQQFADELNKRTALYAGVNKQEFIRVVKQAVTSCESALKEITAKNFIKAREYLTKARKLVLINPAVATEKVEFQKSSMTVVNMLAMVEEKLGPVGEVKFQPQASSTLSLKYFQSQDAFVLQRFADEFNKRLQNQHGENLANLSNVKQRAESAVEYCRQALEKMEQGKFFSARGLLVRAQGVSIDIPDVKVKLIRTMTISQMIASTREKINQFFQGIEGASKLCQMILKKIMAGEYLTAEALFPMAQQSCTSKVSLEEKLLFFKDLKNYGNNTEHLMTVREMFNVVEGELKKAKNAFIESIRAECLAAFQIIIRKGDLGKVEEVLKRIQGLARHEGIAETEVRFFIRINETDLKQGSMTFAGMITTLAIELSRAKRNQDQKQASIPISQNQVETTLKPSAATAVKTKPTLERSSSVFSLFSSIFSSDDKATSQPAIVTSEVTTAPLLSSEPAPIVEPLQQQQPLTAAAVVTREEEAVSTVQAIATTSSTPSPDADEVPQRNDVVAQVKELKRTDSRIVNADQIVLQKQLAAEALSRTRPELVLESSLPFDEMLINLNATLTNLLEAMQTSQTYQIDFQRLAKDVQAACNRFIKLQATEETVLSIGNPLFGEFLEVIQNYSDVVLFALLTMGNQLSIVKQPVFKKHVDAFTATCKLISSLGSDVVPVFGFAVRQEDNWHPYLIDGLKKASIFLEYEQTEKFVMEVVGEFEKNLDDLQILLHKVTGEMPTVQSKELYKDNNEALTEYLNRLNVDTKELCEKISELMQKDLVMCSTSDSITQKFLKAMNDYRDGMFFMLSQMGEKLQHEYINAFSKAYQPKREAFVKLVNWFVANCESIACIEDAIGLPKIGFKVSEELHPYLKNKIEITGMVPADNPYSWVPSRLTQ